MDCELALPLIYDLIDKELTEAERPILEAHLKECAGCRAQLQAIEQAENLYRREIFVEPDSALTTRIVESVLTENSFFVPKSSLQIGEFPSVLTENSSSRPMLNWSTRGIIARVSAVAAGLAAMLYLVISLPISRQFNYRITDITSTLNPTNNLRGENVWRTIVDLRLDLIGKQLIDTVTNTGNQLFAEIPINGSVILILVILQIVISYRLLNRSQLEQDKQL